MAVATFDEIVVSDIRILFLQFKSQPPAFKGGRWGRERWRVLQLWAGSNNYFTRGKDNINNKHLFFYFFFIFYVLTQNSREIKKRKINYRKPNTQPNFLHGNINSNRERPVKKDNSLRYKHFLQHRNGYGWWEWGSWDLFSYRFRARPSPSLHRALQPPRLL